MGYHGARPDGSWWAVLQARALRIKSLPLLRIAEHKVEGGPDGGLVRKLGPWDLVLMGIGASIGAGIFVVTGTVAHDAGPGVVLSFALAGAACVFNALCYGELSTRFPALVGGAYLYTYCTINELTAFLVFCNLMLDYHIGAASIARSLASYLVSLFSFIPAVQSLPAWLNGGQEFYGGWVSINVLAPIVLVILTYILCQGVKESAAVNAAMTVTKVLIVLLVIAVGAFEVDTTNWSPFLPYGVSAVVTGATVVFFSYVGFDAVANSAEEVKKPQRDLPIGILGSLVVCAALYVAVCLVITGMVPYTELGGDAPLALAFKAKGLYIVSTLIGVGAVAGLTTTVLVGLYVQSRLYLGLGRDGLVPTFFARINPEHHTPVLAQIWVGIVAGVLSLFFNVSHLSHILSVGCLSGYSVVAACVLMLRIQAAEVESQHIVPQSSGFSKWQEAMTGILAVTLFSFLVGITYRYEHPVVALVFLVLAVISAVPLYARQEYKRPSTFACPWVPTLPLLGIALNVFLFAQLHWEAWVRFVVLNILAVVAYALYGQHNAVFETAVDSRSPLYEKAPSGDPDEHVQDLN